MSRHAPVAGCYTRSRMPSSLYLPKIVRKRSKLHGWGVFAAEPINKNKIIIDYAGELISNKESDAREDAT